MFHVTMFCIPLSLGTMKGLREAARSAGFRGEFSHQELYVAVRTRSESRPNVLQGSVSPSSQCENV